MASPEDALTKEIQRTYAQAAKEIKQKTEEFWAAHKAKAAQMLADVASGKITQEDYKKWLRGQVFTGNRWKEKLDDITRTYVEADEKAREIINKTDKNVFVRFANAQGNDIKSHIAGYSFDLYDKHTVERLLKEDPKMLPEWKIDKPKDYTWNEKRVKNEIMQGIIQGEDIPSIAKRLSSGLATDNNKKMNMFARTAVTGAQNAGRMERLHEAQDMGVVVKKKWLAAHDNRVRDAHAYLDGQTVEVDEDFITEDGQKISFPGDPSAPPELVYNCRCTLVYVYDVKASAENLNGQEESAEEQEKPAQEQETANTPRSAKFTPAKTIQEAEAQAKQYVSSMGSVSYKGIDLEYANTCNRVLGNVNATFGADKLGSIQPMNMRSKVFKGSTAEAAYRWGGIGGDLFINPTYYKSAATFAAHKAEIDGLTQTVLSNGELLRKNATGRKAEYIDALLNTKRQCVSQSYDFFEASCVHECGHMMDDKVFRKEMREAFGGSIKYADNLAESRHEYGAKISGYAVADNQEYIAESFTAWWYGEGDKIDPKIRAIFEGAMKK